MFFLCPKRDCGALVTDFRAKLECFDTGFAGAVASNCLRLLNRLYGRKSFDDLVNFTFGLCCTDNNDKIVPLKFQKVLSALMEVAATHVASVHNAWFTPGV